MTDVVSHPLDSPAPILMVVAGIAVLVLGSLFVTGLLWEASGPATVSTSHAVVHSQPQPPVKQPG